MADKKFIETGPEREEAGAYEGSRKCREKQEGDGLVDGFLDTRKGVFVVAVKLFFSPFFVPDEKVVNGPLDKIDCSTLV